MPYRFTENGREYLLKRTTEISSSFECEMYARLDKEFKEAIRDKVTEGLTVPLRNVVSALRGTLAHHKIESRLSVIMDIPPPTLELGLAQNNLFKKLRRNADRYKYFLDDIERSFTNFQQWYVDYKDRFRPLFLEKKLVIIKRKEDGTIDEDWSVAGTLDCFGEWLTDEGKWRTAIFDWKTSKRSMLSHVIQLSGYYWELTNHPFYEELAAMGIFNRAPYYFKNGKPQVFCGVFGGRTYDFKQYDVDLSKWLKAWDIHNNPRKLAYSHSSRTVDNKTLCMVCDKILECPEYQYVKVGLKDLPEASIE